MALHDAGWKPVSHGVWCTPEGDQQATLSNKPYETEEICEALAETIEDGLWRRAGKHYLGNGLAKGEPNLEPARRTRKHLVRYQRWNAVAALDAIVCGGCVHSGRYGCQIMCHRGCGEIDTPMHRYWDCPRLADHASAEV